MAQDPADIAGVDELSRLRAQNERLTRYLRAIERTHLDLDVDRTLEAVLDCAEDLFGCSAAMIVLYTGEGEDRHVRASRGLSPEFIHLVESVGHPVAERLAAEPVMALDFGRQPDELVPGELCREAQRHGIGGSLVFRLDHRGSSFGALALHFGAYRELCADERAVASIFTSQAASALAHARDFHEVDCLRREQERMKRSLQEFVDCLHDMILVWDPDLKLIVANASAHRFLREAGWERDGGEVVLQSDPEHCPVHAVLRRPECSISREMPYGERLFEVDCHPLYCPENGRLKAVVEHVRDVTENRLLQRRLMYSEERMRAAMDNAPVGILLFDLEDERVVIANGMMAELSGRPVIELVGLRWLELFAPGDHPALRRALDQLHGALKRTEVEPRLETPDGPMPVGCYAGRIDYSDGTRHVQMMVRDLRPRLKLQAQLVEQEKLAAIGQLASGVAHEIRNPLGIIAGALFDLEELVETDDAEVREDLRIARDEIRRVQDIINNVLDFARTGVPERQDIHLGDLMRRTLALMDKSMASRNVLLDLVVEGEPVCQADPGALRQVALNLLSNAYHATPDGGEIRVRAWQVDEATVALSVADNGSGMAPEVVSNIFHPFYTTKPPGEGTGLGLSIVYNTIREHGGEIEVDSALGRGTMFTIRLPRRPVGPAADSRTDPLTVAADQLSFAHREGAWR